MGAEEKVEFKTTYVYTFIGAIMPRIVGLGVYATSAVSYETHACGTG